MFSLKKLNTKFNKKLSVFIKSKKTINTAVVYDVVFYPDYGLGGLGGIGKSLLFILPR